MSEVSSGSPAPESVQALDASSYGCWLVTTVGSTHLWDIQPDRVLYTRIPGQGRGSFTCDGDQVQLTRVDRWPVVGQTSFIWFDDPRAPQLLEQWRQSSTVRSITAVAQLQDSQEQS